MTVCEETFFFFFFFYGAIKIHRDGVVRQRSVPACALLSSVRHRDPGPVPRRLGARPRCPDGLSQHFRPRDMRPGPGTCGQAQGHAARPRDAGRLGEKRNLRGGVREEASERRRLVAFCSGLLLLLRGPLPQLWELWVPLPGTPPPPNCSSSDGLALSRALRALGRL